jgi:hypothetical protein
MNAETTVVEDKKKGFFAPFASRDEALKGVKEFSTAFYVIAGIQGVVGYFFAPTLIYDAVILAVLATALILWKSRVAAILLLILSTIILGTTVMSRLGMEDLGGTNVFLALILFWAAIKSVEGTFKLHGRFSENRDDELSFKADAVRTDD